MMETTQLQTLLIEVSGHAVRPYIRQLALPDLLKQTEAHRLFGRGNVERWLDEGLVTRQGKHYSRAQLTTVAAQLNRLCYLTVSERKAKNAIFARP